MVSQLLFYRSTNQPLVNLSHIVIYLDTGGYGVWRCGTFPNDPFTLVEQQYRQHVGEDHLDGYEEDCLKKIIRV